MFTPDNSDASLERLFRVLSVLPKRDEISEEAPRFFAPVCKFSPREAVFSPFEKVKASEALGRILAQATVSCPPAVPILVPGELVDSRAISIFEYYGIDEIFVLKA